MSKKASNSQPKESPKVTPKKVTKTSEKTSTKSQPIPTPKTPAKSIPKKKLENAPSKVEGAKSGLGRGNNKTKDKK